MTKLKILNLQEGESLSLNCTTTTSFEYKSMSGNGWSAVSKIKKESFKKGVSYNFTKSNPKTSGDRLHCKELGLDFKKEYIENLLNLGILIGTN